jgi:hypothetical protein
MSAYKEFRDTRLAEIIKEYEVMYYWEAGDEYDFGHLIPKYDYEDLEEIEVQRRFVYGY